MSREKYGPMIICGVVLPEGCAVPINIADDFTSDEVGLISLKGLPIQVDHYDGVVGEIIHEWVGFDKKKYVIGRIDGDSKKKIATQVRINRKTLVDFSLTHNFRLFEDTSNGKLYQTKTPIEVSVCREGRRDKCHIIYNTQMKKESLYTKTSTLYNYPNQTIPTIVPLRNLNTIQYINHTMSANAGSTVPDLSVSDILEQYNNMKKDSMERERLFLEERTKFEAENDKLRQIVKDTEKAKEDAIAKERQREKEHFDREIDTLFETVCKTQGVEPSPDFQKSVEIMKNGCSMEVFPVIREVLGGMISANKDQKDTVEKLNRALEEERMKRNFDTYTKLSQPSTSFTPTTSGRLSTVESRFATPPEVKIPIPGVSSPNTTRTPVFVPSSSTFYNPNNGSVGTQVSLSYPTKEAPVHNCPIVTNWNEGHQNNHNNYRQIHEQEVKANKAGTVGNGSWDPSIGFPLDRMVMYSRPIETVDVNSTYDMITQNLTEHNQRVSKRSRF